jgi:glycosyltransferase involved in cell wall biosynthesis
MAKITILTPFRNASAFIGETACSIFNQTHADWEWILINDHTMENEVNVLNDVLQDPRVVLLDNQGKGIVDALVTGFEQATGTYVTRMDADDLMPSNKLERFVALHGERTGVIVTGKVAYFSPNTTISSGYKAYEKWLNQRIDLSDYFANIYRECSLASGNWLMLTDDLQRCGGFEGLVYPEDYDLLFRWYKYGFCIEGLNEITHLWRDHELRTSKTSDNYRQEAFFRLKVMRFVELDWDNSKVLVVNGTGQKGKLTAKQLIELQVPFIWVSHEPERYSQGLMNQRVYGLNELHGNSKAQLLNTTLLSEPIIQGLYSEKFSEIEVILL